MKKNFLAVLFALALCSPTFAQWRTGRINNAGRR